MRQLPAVVTVIFLGAALSFSLWSAQADQPNVEETGSESNDDESVEVRLARAHVDLARLDLHRAMEANEQIPNLFSTEYIEELRLHVVTDDAQLEQSLMGEDADPHQICIRSAEATVTIAEAQLTRLRAANERRPTAVSDLSVERASVVAEIAKLNLERAQHLENSEFVVTHLQWQIDELRHQVLELQISAHAHRH